VALTLKKNLTPWKKWAKSSKIGIFLKKFEINESVSSKNDVLLPKQQKKLEEPKTVPFSKKWILRALAICKKPGEETITRIRKKEESK
jgi:hypothetical protein